MKQLLLSMAMLYAITAQSQTDTTANNSDTIKVGNYVIVKKDKDGSTEANNRRSVSISSSTSDLLDISFGNTSKKKKNPNVSTNWWIFDLGFANFRDQTNYGAAQSGSYFQVLKPGTPEVDSKNMNLINGKSSNVNIWFFMQRFNLAKQKLNLKYGLGLEMYNFRYEHSISYRKDPENFVFNDSISFSKNKLYAGYLTIPFMINFTPIPEKRNSLSISAGISAGYLISSRNKQISAERGKQKIRGNFDLEPFRIAAIAELGLGPIKLYGSYSLNTLHKSSTGVEQYPFAFGIRFSSL